MGAQVQQYCAEVKGDDLHSTAAVVKEGEMDRDVHVQKNDITYLFFIPLFAALPFLSLPRSRPSTTL